MKRIWQFITGHLVWKHTDRWIKHMGLFGDYCDYTHVPKKLMSKWEWWFKWSNINS